MYNSDGFDPPHPSFSLYIHHIKSPSTNTINTYRVLNMAISFSLILTLTFIFFISPTTADESNNSTTNFLQCFQAMTWFIARHTVHYPNTPLYESILQSTARNGRPFLEKTSSKPSIITTPEEECHVSVIAKCAYANGLQVRTRSGGHDYEGMSSVSTEDGTKHPFILIDLALLKKIVVDNTSRTAWVQAGAILGELYYHVFNQTGGTAGFPAGTCPTIGVGGHLSVGGIGTMMRKHGVAADNVVDVRMVGKDGVMRDRKLMGEEVFWAVRGGGAQSWGIVVAYKIRVVDVPSSVTAFTVSKDVSITKPNGASLVTRWQEVAPKLDENLFIQATLYATAASSGATIQLQLQALYLGNCDSLLHSMSTSYPELNLTKRDCTPMTWLQSVLYFYGLPLTGKGVDALLDRPLASPSFSFKSKSDFVTHPITQPQWKEILKNISSLNTTFWMQLLPMGAKMDQIPESAIPFPHRRGNLYNIQYLTMWGGTDVAETRRRIEFMRRLYAVMTPYVSKSPRAAYYGFKDYDLGRNRQVFPSYEEASGSWGTRYFKSNFRRLAHVKRMVDAGNYFRNEQSIPPFHSAGVNTEDNGGEVGSSSSYNSNSYFAQE